MMVDEMSLGLALEIELADRAHALEMGAITREGAAASRADDPDEQRVYLGVGHTDPRSIPSREI